MMRTTVSLSRKQWQTTRIRSLKLIPQEDETILVLGVIGVEELNGVLAIESSARFLEGNAVLPNVPPVLPPVPLKPELFHKYNVCMSDTCTKRISCSRTGEGAAVPERGTGLVEELR